VSLPTDPASLILGPSFERVQAFALVMSKGSVSVPQHLKNNIGDCLAVTLQALSLGFNPFAFATKTYKTPGGVLSYEGQLVSAIVTASGAIEGDPTYEHIGDWNKVLGKVEEKKGDNGKYYVATYTKQDEAGLGVIVRATLKGEDKPRELTVMMSQAYPRFSTQWATDPRQQICNLAVRKFVRLHKPGVLLGFRFTDDEDEYVPPKDLGAAELIEVPADLIKRGKAAAAAGMASYQAFWKACTNMERALLSEKSDHHEQFKTAAAAADKNRTVDNDTKPAAAKSTAASQANPTTGETTAPPAADTASGGFTPTFASVLDMMVKAPNRVALEIAGDWIPNVEERFHEELLKKLHERRDQLPE